MNLLSTCMRHDSWDRHLLLASPALSRRFSWTLASALLLVLACTSDSLKPPLVADDRDLYWALELNHHAVTLSTTAPYDTLTLKATPRNYLGEPLPGFPAPVYRSADIERVVVTADGRLVAVAPTATVVPVFATLTAGNLKYSDTVFVLVVSNPTPPVLASLSIQPAPPDSAKSGAIGGNDYIFAAPVADTLPLQVVDTDGLSITGIPVHFRSSDPTIVRVFGGTNLGGSATATIYLSSGFPHLRAIRFGSATIYATTTAFGVTKADTLAYTVGRPIYVAMSTGNPTLGQNPGMFSGPDFEVGTGAIVVWFRPEIVTFAFAQQPITIDEIDITFAEADLPKISPAPAIVNLDPFLSTYCYPVPWAGDCANGGSIVLGGGTFSATSSSFPAFMAARTFPVPGTYHYRSMIHGTSGRIVVVDER